jgi:hypothetical protein
MKALPCQKQNCNKISYTKMKYDQLDKTMFSQAKNHVKS